MPSIKDFDKKSSNPKAKPKRRPGRDTQEANSVDEAKTVDHVEMTTEESSIKVVDVESGRVTQAETESTEHMAAEENLESQEASQQTYEHATQEEKIEIQFPGSEMVRSRFPKPFEVAEKVATDWVKDGDFQNLQVGNPLVEFVAAKGLRQAKDLEKKVLNSPVTEKVAMQVFTAGMKAQGLIQDLKNQVDQIRSKVKK